MYDLNGVCGLTGLLARVAAVFPEPLRIAQTMATNIHNSLYSPKPLLTYYLWISAREWFNIARSHNE